MVGALFLAKKALEDSSASTGPAKSKELSSSSGFLLGLATGLGVAYLAGRARA